MSAFTLSETEEAWKGEDHAISEIRFCVRYIEMNSLFGLRTSDLYVNLEQVRGATILGNSSLLKEPWTVQGDQS